MTCRQPSHSFMFLLKKGNNNIRIKIKTQKLNFITCILRVFKVASTIFFLIFFTNVSRVFFLVIHVSSSKGTVCLLLYNLVNLTFELLWIDIRLLKRYV